MKVTGKAKVRNRFDILCRDVVTGEEQKYQAHNIVLDSMWSRLVNFQPFFDYIHFGTGTGTLSPSRTSLFSHLGTKSASSGVVRRALPTSWRRRQIVLNPEEYVGHELTEVGVAYSEDSTSLVTHAFIEDSEGNPISIVKTDTMVVTIYATIFFELGELTSMYGGQWRWAMPLASNDLLSYLMGATFPTTSFWVTGAWQFWEGGKTPVTHGSSSDIHPASWTKDAANKKATTPVRRLGINDGNGKVRGFGLGNIFEGQLPISGVFAGHTIEGEQIGIGDGETVGFSPAWDMIQNATVYVDGIEVTSGVTVRPGYPAGTNISHALINLGSSEGHPLEPWMDSLVSVTEERTYTAEIPAALAAEVETFAYSIAVGSSSDARVRLYTREDEQADWVELLDRSYSGLGAGGAKTDPITIPDGHTLLRVRLTGGGGNPSAGRLALLRAADKHLFEFDTPPDVGAVITADYTVPYIPKDENHVLDLQCSIQWGEG